MVSTTHTPKQAGKVPENPVHRRAPSYPATTTTTAATQPHATASPLVCLLYLLVVLHVCTAPLLYAGASTTTNSVAVATTDNASTVCTFQVQDVRCDLFFTSFRELVEHCVSLGVENNFFLNIVGLNRDSMLGVHLDFCDAVPPLVFLFNDDYATVNRTGNCSLVANGNRTISCEDIFQIADDDNKLREFHEDYVDILERHEFSLEREKRNETEETDRCKRAYKDWLCSSTKLSYHLNGRNIRGCNSTANSVCLHCPSFEPSSGFGGFMAFQCEDDASDGGDCDCAPSCISERTLRQFNSTITGG